MARIQLIKAGRFVSTEGIRREGDRLVIILDERISDLNHENNDLLRRFARPRYIKMHDADSCRGWSVLVLLPKKQENAVVLDRVLASCNVACKPCFRVGSLDIRRYHVVHEV